MLRRVPVLVLACLFAVAGTVQAHWPVANRYSYVSQWFSSRHTAIDIPSACGTRIVAALRGTVIWSGWRSNGGGYQVWVRTPRDGLDLFTLYGHMRSRPPVYRGQRVAVGQRLGYVGSTGYSTGCHLHVEMWRGYFWRAGSYPVNPWRRINHGYWFPYRYR